MLHGGGVILCVIIGHLVPFGKLVWLWIFSFHMPFFFIVSGYCTGEKSFDLTFPQYLRKYAKSLLLPALFIRVVYQAVGVSGVDFASVAWPRDSLLNFISPLAEWFIMSLFFAKILFYWVHKSIHLSERQTIQRIITFVIIGTVFYLGQTWNAAGFHGEPYWFPAPIDCSLIALSFMTLGYWCRKVRLMDALTVSRNVMLPAGVAALLVLLWLIQFQSYTNVCDMYFGNGSLSYFVFAAVISFFTMLASSWMVSRYEMSRLTQFLELFGRNTIIVYPGHTIIFFMLNQIIYKYTGVLYVPMHEFTTTLIFIYLAISVVLLTLACLFKEKLQRDYNIAGLPLYGKHLGVVVIVFSIAIGACYAVGLSKQSYSTIRNVLYINSEADFLSFRDSVNGGNDYKGWTVLQQCDLDLSDVDNFEPIGIFDSDKYFCGTYDGQGHFISNLRIAREDNCALFPILGGTVCNLNISSGSISGNCVGSIASHATQEGVAQIINCINNADVTGLSRAGGIADNFNGKIFCCVNTGSVTAVSGITGGIVSYSALDVSDSYSNGPLYPGTFAFEGTGQLQALNKNEADFHAAEGAQAVEHLRKLYIIDNADGQYVFHRRISGNYYVGMTRRLTEKYLVSVLLIIAIAISALNARKRYRMCLDGERTYQSLPTPRGSGGGR